VRSPTVEHLKRLLALGIRRHAFAPGQEHEEAQQLWLAAGKPEDFDAFWMQLKRRTRVACSSPAGRPWPSSDNWRAAGRARAAP